MERKRRQPPWSAKGLADGTYLCGVWVGIDGTAGTNDVLQAGTGSQCVVTGGKFVSTSFFAWTEWFSLGSVVVANFPVAVGDEISSTVCAPFGNTHGTALFNNLTSGLTTTIGINPPAGVSLSGMSPNGSSKIQPPPPTPSIRSRTMARRFSMAAQRAPKASSLISHRPKRSTWSRAA